MSASCKAAGPDAAFEDAAALVARLDQLLREDPADAEPGTRFFIVAAYWFSRWRKFKKAVNEGCYIDANYDPGPVDNSELLLSTISDGTRSGCSNYEASFCALKPRLVFGYDFNPVGVEAWELIRKVFGGGPELPRLVVKLSPNARPELDIYPVHVLVSIADSDSGLWRNDCVEELFVSRALELAAFEQHLREEVLRNKAISLEDDRYRLHGALYGNDFVRINTEKDSMTTVGDANWCENGENARVLVEIVREDGTWPREQPHRRSSSLSSYGSSITQKRLRNGVHVDDGDSRKRKGSLGDGGSKSIRTIAAGELSFTPKHSGSFTLNRQLAPPPQSAFAVIPGTREQGNPIYNNTANTKSQNIAKGMNKGDDRGSPSRGVTGLRNLGNTCFMNATLQCLNQAQKLIAYLIDERRLRESLISVVARASYADKSLVLGYAELTKMLWSRQHSVVTPSGFLRVVSSNNALFGDSSQHDAQEFLMWLLNNFHEETNQAVSARTSFRDIDTGLPIESESHLLGVEGFDDMPMDDVASPPRKTRRAMYESEEDSDLDSMMGDTARLLRANDAWDKCHRKDDSVILDLFQGQVESRLECEQCRHMSSTFDVFTMLSLPLVWDSNDSDSSPMLTIEKCLEQYISKEHLFDEVSFDI